MRTTTATKKRKEPKPWPEKRIEARITDLVASNKFLRRPEQHKYNYWIVAHWESWACQGKAGGCSTCHNDYYSHTLRNKRATNGKDKWGRDITGKLCGECARRIEKLLGVEFKRNHCK